MWNMEALDILNRGYCVLEKLRSKTSDPEAVAAIDRRLARIETARLILIAGILVNDARRQKLRGELGTERIQ